MVCGLGRGIRPWWTSSSPLGSGLFWGLPGEDLCTCGGVRVSGGGGVRVSGVRVSGGGGVPPFEWGVVS